MPNKISIVFNYFVLGQLYYSCKRNFYYFFFWGGGEGRGGDKKRCIVEDVKMENVLIYAK